VCHVTVNAVKRTKRKKSIRDCTTVEKCSFHRDEARYLFLFN
jgi:hypothetical protein